MTCPGETDMSAVRIASMAGLIVRKRKSGVMMTTTPIAN
jgi:hypothetical protein